MVTADFVDAECSIVKILQKLATERDQEVAQLTHEIRRLRAVQPPRGPTYGLGALDAPHHARSRSATSVRLAAPKVLELQPQPTPRQGQLVESALSYDVRASPEPSGAPGHSPRDASVAKDCVPALVRPALQPVGPPEPIPLPDLGMVNGALAAEELNGAATAEELAPARKKPKSDRGVPHALMVEEENTVHDALDRLPPTTPTRQTSGGLEKIRSENSGHEVSENGRISSELMPLPQDTMASHAADTPQSRRDTNASTTSKRDRARGRERLQGLPLARGEDAPEKKWQALEPPKTTVAPSGGFDDLGVDSDQKVTKWAAISAENMEQNGEPLRAASFRLLMTPKFDTVLGVVIVLNSAMIGVEMTLVEGEARNATILQPTPETLPFMVCENIFLLIYCVEIFLRIFACRWDAFASGWVRFDALLVFVGISGTWILPVVTLLFLPTGGGSAASVPMVLRVFRLARLARALRLLPHFRPLWMLVHGMTSSASTIMNVFVVLFMTLYVFGCIANEMITNHEKRKDGGWFDDTVELYFRSLPMSMVTLIQFVSFDSVGQIYRPMIQAAPELLCFFVPFLLIVSIVLMNLVTAIIVEAFLAHAKEDNEMRKKEQERRVQSMIPQLKRMFEEMDEDGSGTLTLDELEDAPDYLKEELSKCLDTESLIELWEILDNHCMGEVSIEEFCEGITKVATSAQPMEFTRIMKQLSFLREDLDMVLQKVCPNKKPRFTRARRSSGSVLHRRTEELRNSVEPETDRRQSAKTDISGESESNGQCQASSVPLEESDHEGSPQSRCARQSTTSNADSSTATRLARRNIRQSAVHIVARPRHVRATVEAGRNFAAAMAEKDLAREGTPNGRTTTTPHVSSAAQPPARRVSGGPSRLRTSRPSNGSHT